MPQTYLSHDELQHIEHCNKVLEAHLDLVNAVTSLSQEKVTDMINAFRGYATAIREIQSALGDSVQNIYRSTRELKQAVGGSQEVQNYIQAVSKLNDVLDDKLIEKLRRITHADSASTDNRDQKEIR